MLLLALEKNSSLCGGGFIADASSRLQADYDVAILAASNFYIVLDGFKNNKEVMSYAIQYEHSYDFQYASDELKDDYEIAFTAVCYNANNIQYVSDRLMDNKNIILAAVQEYNGENIKYASKKLRDDKEVIKTAILYQGNKAFSILSKASKRLQEDEELNEIADKEWEMYNDPLCRYDYRF